MTKPPGGTGSKLLTLAALVMALSGCAELTGTPIITSSASPAATVNTASLPPAVPGESLEARLARLEFDLAQLKLDYSVVRPSFETLVAREKDLGSRVAAMESVIGPVTAAVPPKAAAGPAPLTPNMPASLVPHASSRPAPASKPAPAPAPAKAASHPAPATVKPGGPFALHLASYRSRDRLAEGWRELQAGHPGELTGLTVRIQRIDTGESGVFQRLLAGPVSSRTAADGLCRTLSAQGVYCKPVAFTGDTL